MQYTTRYDSPLGGIFLASDGEHLTGLWFEKQKYYARTLDPEHEEREIPVFRETRCWLDQYFSGKIPDFLPPLYAAGTDFQRKVWEILLTIPYGQTVTYGEIAGRITAARGGVPALMQGSNPTSMQGGKPTSARAVGSAVGHNPISILIPCHRVVGANGSLTGYAGGIERKKRLLETECRGKIGADFRKPSLRQSEQKIRLAASREENLQGGESKWI